MADLEPYVGVREGIGWVSENTIEALEALVVLALLLVDDTQTKEDFVGFIKV